MPVPDSTPRQLPAWPQRLLGLLLLAVFCLAGLTTAQASAEYDPYSHNISLNHAVTVSHVADSAHLWDSDTALPTQVQIERIYRDHLSPTSQASAHPQPLTAFTARAPPASAP